MQSVNLGIIHCRLISITTWPSRQLHVQKLTIETLEQSHQNDAGGFIVNVEHISHLCSSVSVVDFEHVNAGWGALVPICWYDILYSGTWKKV